MLHAFLPLLLGLALASPVELAPRDIERPLFPVARDSIPQAVPQSVERTEEERDIELHDQSLITIPGSSNTGDPASNNTNSANVIPPPQYQKNTSTTAQPLRAPGKGANMLGPVNAPMQNMNPDLLGPPTTDAGTVPNAKWPFALSHNKISNGGWARQQTVNQLPVATAMAAVNMRLVPGAIRELHWHTAAEWAIVLKGSVIVSAVNSDGQVSIGQVNEGDLWYFPVGTPHILQATGAGQGAEFLLVFDTGSFDEDSTFLLTDWFAHIPRGVLNKNFGFELNSTAFSDIPAEELYIFRAPAPAPVDEEKVSSPNGDVPNPFTFAFSQQEPQQTEGGWVKVVDSSTFKASVTIAAAMVHVQPGGMRELHWHPNSDEWDYFMNGTMRVGVFAANSDAATFDFEPGDVGYISQNFGTYAECISEDPCTFLEVFRSDHYADVSLNQWLALTPVQVVADHLRVTNDTISQFRKQKPIVVKGNTGWT